MTTAPTPEEVHALADRLEHCVSKWGKQNALSLEAYSAVKMMRRLQVENDLLREKADRLPADWESDSSLETWFPLTAGLLAELEARKPLPLSYRAGLVLSSRGGGATVTMHFNDMAEAEAWFVGTTDQHDAALVDKSPNLQEPLVDKTANLQDRPASLIASREVVADGPLRVTRLHLTEEGRAALTSKATGPLPGITGGSS